MLLIIEIALGIILGSGVVAGIYTCLFLTKPGRKLYNAFVNKTIANLFSDGAMD
jgi:hypothetical protein